MNGAILLELLEARHANLVREATHGRRIAVVRRNGTITRRVPRPSRLAGQKKGERR
jgi:hypothetical protein